MPASCSQHLTRRKVNFLRLMVLFESFNGISQVVPLGHWSLALTAPVCCVGVGADQQWDVQLLGWVSDGEDNLGESREAVGGFKSRPKAAPSSTCSLGISACSAGSAAGAWLRVVSSCKHGHSTRAPAVPALSRAGS